MANDTLDLGDEACLPCDPNQPPMALPEASRILKRLHEGWSINNMGRLERVFLLKDFQESLKLGCDLGEIALKADHYPDLLIAYGTLRVEIWTHKIGGLTRADFVLAAKFDRIS